MAKLLMTPGPTNVPDRVLQKSAEAMINHRSNDYYQLFGELNERLKRVFKTKNPVLTFPAAGTGGLEAAVVNLFSPGDRVLVVVIGEFGARFAKIAKTYGVIVKELKYPDGKVAVLEEVIEAIDPDIKAVIITHNETSTGVANNIQALGQYLKDKDTPLIVDAVSSLGGMNIETDQWGLDVVITGAQKSLMTPPGLAMISVSERAWKLVEKATIPRFYFDFKKALEYMNKDKPQNPYTPAVSLIAALNEALTMMEEEGLDNVFARHQKVADLFREGIQEIGFELLAQDGYYSNTVTAIKTEKIIDASTLQKRLEKDYGIIIAGGQGDLKGKIVRVGHLGMVNEEMVQDTLAAIKNIIKEEQ